MESLLFPVLLLGVMYVFLILPQRKKQKAATALLASLAPGDEVMTVSGIYGGVTEVDGQDVYLEIAPDVEIKITKSAISSRVHAAGAAETPKKAIKSAFDVAPRADETSVADDEADSDSSDTDAKRKRK